jgi:hypothetical protein
MFSTSIPLPTRAIDTTMATNANTIDGTMQQQDAAVSQHPDPRQRILCGPYQGATVTA